jgi:hypothetical protein
MTVPERLSSAPNKVCELQKSLYGLEKTSRKWYAKLTSLLLNEGYMQSTSDYSLLIYKQGTDFIALLVYVDYYFSWHIYHCVK